MQVPSPSLGHPGWWWPVLTYTSGRLHNYLPTIYNYYYLPISQSAD